MSSIAVTKRSGILSAIAENSATNNALRYYSSFKNSSRILGFGLGIAENSVKFVANPVISYLDNYALWLEDEVDKVTKFHVGNYTIHDIYVSTRFLLEVSSTLALGSYKFYKNSFSYKKLFHLSKSVAWKLAKREPKEAIANDLVNEIYSMTDLIFSYLDKLRSQADKADFVTFGKLVLTLEQGLQRVLEVLPSKTSEVKIIVTPPNNSTHDDIIKRKSSRVIESDLPKKVKQQAPPRKSSQTKHKAHKKADLSNSIGFLFEQIDENPVEETPLATPIVSTPITPASSDETVRVVDAESVEQEIKENVEQPIEESSSKKEALDIKDESEFPSLAHKNIEKKSYVSVLSSSQPKMETNVPQIIDLSSLDHEKNLRVSIPITSSKVESDQVDSESASESDEEDYSIKESNDKPTYSDALRYHTKGPDTEWNTYHSNNRHHQGPIIGNLHRASISATFDSNPYVSLLNVEASPENSDDETITAPRNSTDKSWHKALPIKKDRRHHFAHSTLFNNKPVTSFSDSNQFSAFAEEEEREEKLMKKEEAKNEKLREEFLVELEKERLAANNRLQQTKKMEEGERNRLMRGIRANETLSRNIRAHEKKVVIALEEKERKARFADYIQTLILQRQLDNESEKIEHEFSERMELQHQAVEAEVSAVDAKILEARRLSESNRNRKLAANLEAGEKQRILDEISIRNEMNNLEREITLKQVIKLENEERNRRIEESKLAQSQLIDSTLTGSPMM